MGPDASDDGSRSAAEEAAGLFDLGFHTNAASDRSAQFEERLEKPGDRVGIYELVELLGEGGFGRVWQVLQREPIRRELALKLIKAGMDSREIIARFEAESRALAMMDHPNIAAVIDAGTTADGRPYFAMELVKGEPITVYCDRNRLGIAGRLELFIPVCHAVQHAHQKGILHRDLKPSNILVIEVDGRPVPKVIDFGIAKALGAEEETCPESSLLLTRYGMIIGTPQYMSPEQAGSMPDVDTRSDIYSLGVILYELMTSTTPLAVQSRNLAAEEWLQRVRLEETPRPSSRFQLTDGTTRIAAELRGAEPGRLRRELNGDLDWIILKALEKDRQRRYETATGLAKDLERYLVQQPVSAVAPSWHYQFGKFARRNRGALAAAAVVTLALLAGTGVSLWQAAVARAATSKAEKSRDEAELSYQEARKSVETFLTRITDDARLNEPDFRQLRSDLLKSAVPFYEKMAGIRSSDYKLQYEQIWALGRLAALYQHRGDVEASLNYYNEAIQLAQTHLAGGHSGDLEMMGLLAMNLNNISTLLSAQGRKEEAIVWMEKSVQLQSRLVELSHDSSFHRRALSLVLMNVGMNLDKLGRDREAEDSLRRSLAIARELFAANPGVLESLSQLGGSTTTLGSFLCERKHYDEGVALFEEGRDLQERLLSSYPNDLGIRFSLAQTCNNMAYELQKLGRSEEALASYRRALSLHGRLADDYGKSTDVDSVAVVSYNLASTLRKEGKRDEAKMVAGQALAMANDAVVQHPDAVGNLKALGLIHRMLGETERDDGRLQEAVGHFRQASEALAKAAAISPLDMEVPAQACYGFRQMIETVLRQNDLESVAVLVKEYISLNPKDWEMEAWVAEQMVEIAHRAEIRIPCSCEKQFLNCDFWSRQAIAHLQAAIVKGCPDASALESREKLWLLRSRADFQALVGPEVMDALAPRKFFFSFSRGDAGRRIWNREGSEWKETQPNGTVNEFQIVGRIYQGIVPGTEIERMKDPKDHFFIPDLQANGGNRLLMKGQSGWGVLGGIVGTE